MTKIEDLLVKYLKIKKEKREYINSQSYEKAAMARDIERNLARSLYIEISGETDAKVIDRDSWVKFEDDVDIYFTEKYGYSVDNVESLSQVIRDIN